MNKIIEYSNIILDYLLEFRKNNQDFTFSLRKRDSPMAKDVVRLEAGQWFQGADYIYVPLFKRGDNARKVKTIGFVVSFNSDNSMNNYIEISAKSGGFSTEELMFHKELADFLHIELDNHYVGKYYFKNKDLFKNLDYYIEDFRKHAVSRLTEYNLVNKYIIDERSFQNDMSRIRQIKRNIIKASETSEKEEAPVDTNNAQMEKFPLNQILYGPPGTGKTYHTINKALSIIENTPEDVLATESREELKLRYNRAIADGRIVFTTFHQSMSYEDFVEGIKPETINEKVIYEIQEGIFKALCIKANGAKGNFDEVLEKFKIDTDHLLKKQTLTIKSKATDFDIQYRGTNLFYVQPHNSVKQDPWYAVNIENIRKVFETGSYEKIYNPTYVREIIVFLKLQYNLKKDIGSTQEPHVLIIDEINRGNVSAIFGELITCIEDSKRLGNDEALEVTLPYSKTKFGVPNNVYIIGTMNTADRSVEALDTALRRRFSFTEMLPKPALISPQKMIWDLWWQYANVGWDDKDFLSDEASLHQLLGERNLIGFSASEKDKLWGQMKDDGANETVFGELSVDLNLKELLEKINLRLEKLLSRDHTIGHSFFLGLKSEEDLYQAFFNKIIPLLQEYFFGDYGKIGLVLGSAFVEEVKLSDRNLFADFKYEDKDLLLEKKVYRINDFKDGDVLFIDAVKAIYAHA